MDTFNFGMLTSNGHQYEDNGAMLKFGGNYRFTSRPSAPPARLHQITIAGMKYYEDNGVALLTSVIDTEYGYESNIMMLDAFYRAHERWDPFILSSPVFGDKVVYFEQSLQLPPFSGSSYGVVAPFVITFREQA